VKAVINLSMDYARPLMNAGGGGTFQGLSDKQTECVQLDRTVL
jgi:hypothetical protein